MREQQVVGGAHAQGVIFQTGRVQTQRITHPGHNGRFIVCDPVLDAVTQHARDRIGICDKGLGGGAHSPAAFIFQGLGQYASDMILLGTLPVIAMAVITDILMGALVRVVTPRALREAVA